MKHLCLFLLLIVSLAGISGVYAENIATDLSDNLLRLHVIANSDSKKDQEIKLKVRDEILKVASDNPKKESLTETVNNALAELGADYGGEVDITHRHVPEKTYKNIHLPQGLYNCINVTLGDGKGENWWCIAYPPLCFTEDVFGDLSEEGRLILENKLSEESFRAIVYDGKVNMRFRLVDEFIKLKNKLW